MTRTRIILVVAAAVLFCRAGANTHTDEAAQTDTSRGLGVYGPVSEKGDTFDTKTDVDLFTYAGDALLVLTPKTPVKHVVDDNFKSTYSVQAVDVDGDGDIDILGAAFWADEITWWSNDNGSGTSWTEHTIDGDFPRACSVYAACIDDDGYIDVLGAAFAGNDIAWWKNDGGSGTSWVEHTIDGDVAGARSVYAVDVDGDGDTDVLGAARSADGIIWWSNDDGSGKSWTEHKVDGDFDGARSVYAADIDGDGDMDVLGAAIYADDITWWSNDDGSGTSWTEYTVAGDFDGARSVYAEDVDGDGDMDILGAAGLAYDTTWWENNDGFGKSWTEHTIEGSFNNASSVYAADIDEDGDTDVLGASAAAYGIIWWENYDGSGTSWTEHTVDDDFGIAWSVCAGDVDNDGVTDVLGAASVTNYITWWEVTGYTDGKLVSSIYDTEGSLEWGAVDWAAGTPEGTAAESRVRSSSEAGDLGGWSPGITTPGGLGSYPTDGDQYKAILRTANDDDTSILEGVDVNGTSETFGTIERTWDGTLPTAYALYQSRPNPAKGNAVIAFELPENAEVTLSVYDIRGRKVKTLVDETLTAGTHERTVSGLPEGVYVYKLSAGYFTAARKMVIVGSDF